MTALLATISSVLFGGADFLGGLASRRESALAVSAVSQLAGVLLLAPMLFLIAAPQVGRADLLWGAAGGLMGTFGIVAFYEALGSGPMSLVAPLAASVGAVVPVVYDLGTGGLPSPLRLAGIILAILAIVIISMPERRDGAIEALTSRVLALSLTAGVGFAGFYVFLSFTGESSGLWPLAGARAASLSLLLIATLLRRGTLRIRPDVRKTTVSAGVVDMSANLFVVLALQRGPLAVASVLSSLYPASTVLLAWAFLNERPGRRHLAGVALAMVAVALTSAG